MEKILYLSGWLTRFLLIACLSGCGWIALLDTNSYDDGIQNKDLRYCEEYISFFRPALLGLSKDEILDELGEPVRTNYFDNFPLTSKFREDQLVFDGSRVCRMADCMPIFMNESWIYRTRIQIDDVKSVRYEWAVYFDDDVVVAVE